MYRIEIAFVGLPAGVQAQGDADDDDDGLVGLYPRRKRT